MSEFFEVVGMVFSAACIVLCFSVLFGVVELTLDDDEGDDYRE